MRYRMSSYGNVTTGELDSDEITTLSGGPGKISIEVHPGLFLNLDPSEWVSIRLEGRSAVEGEETTRC